MEQKISPQAEEYLEAIYRLQKRKGIAKTTELASELNVVPGSITNTVQHLKKHGLVKHKPYQGVKLTGKGEKKALNVLRRHRLAERLLTDILNADWSNAHNNACKLEHALTEEMIALMDKKLGYPKFCPHGNPIPSEDCELRDEECSPLSEASINAPYVITRIVDEKPMKLLVLATKELKPGIEVQVLERDPDKLVLAVNGKQCILDRDIASDICIKSPER
jgi:DtxR family Mn-dependent transcriptional regulator